MTKTEERIRSDIQDLFEKQESMVTLDEDGMTGWDFAELRDAVTQHVSDLIAQERREGEADGIRLAIHLLKPFYKRCYCIKDSLCTDHQIRMLEDLQKDLEVYLSQTKGDKE
jgi:hypothetical protein